jgi:hypothetical protein
MMHEERFDFDEHCSNSLSGIANCFLFPFEPYEDFVAVDDLDFFDDVVSVGGDSCGLRSSCGVE